MEERAAPQPADPMVATPASPTSISLGPAPASLRSLGRAGGMRGGGAALSRAKLVHGMQISHGNAAVARAARALAREADERARKLAGFNDAKAKGNWGDAAEWLNGLNEEDIQRQLATLNKNQLRQLDAGAMRQIPSFAGRVHDPIMAKLGKAPGSVFGKLNFLPGAPENGGGPMTAYALPVDFSFASRRRHRPRHRDRVHPDVQARPYGHQRRRRLAEREQASPDRRPHRSRPRRPAARAGSPATSPTPRPARTSPSGTPAAPDGFATYTDRPSAQFASTDWSFETAAVGKGGADEGVIYASCAWGFTVDENCILTPKASKISDKPSGSFGAAVDKWNQQAAGPVDQRNAPNQEKLPAVR